MPDGFSDNILQFLRRRNIFGVPGTIGNDLPEQGGIMGNIRPIGSVIEDEYDPAARMQEIYQPETDISERYSEALGRMPIRNKPSALRKIAAVIGAFGSRGAENVERALYSPYHRQMQDWQTEIEPLREGAQLERQSNANLRMMANQIISQEQSDRRIARQLKRDETLSRQGDVRLQQGEERLSQADQRIKQADARIKIAQEVAKGGQFEVDDVGNARIIRKDGTAVPVDATYLSFEEKEALRAETTGAITAAREGAKRDRIVERVIADPDNPDRFIRARVNLDTGDVEPLTVRRPTREPSEPERRLPAAAPRTQLEEGREVVNRAQKAKLSNPRWSRWITIKGNKVTIREPGMFSEPGGMPSTRPSKAEYDQIYTQIYGTTPSDRGRGVRPVNAPPSGRVRVIGPDGETGTVTEEEARSLPEGWRRQ